MAEHNTIEYWDRRTRENKQDMKSLLFRDPRYHAMEERVRTVLMAWKDMDVLDVACGPGRFSDIFERYTGTDFSGEMVALAKERCPDKNIYQRDARELPERQYDVIFEVNSLKSLGMTVDQFIELNRPYAKKFVACLEAERFIIENVYGTL